MYGTLTVFGASLLFFFLFYQAGSASKTREVGSGMLVEHSGRAPRLEMVSFKKLNKGTLALGVVFKVSIYTYLQVFGISMGFP